MHAEKMPNFRSSKYGTRRNNYVVRVEDPLCTRVLRSCIRGTMSPRKAIGLIGHTLVVCHPLIHPSKPVTPVDAGNCNLPPHRMDVALDFLSDSQPFTLMLDTIFTPILLCLLQP